MQSKNVNSRIYATPSLILLSIETFDCWDFRGHFFMPFLKECVSFSSSAQFLKQANLLMDNIGKPERMFEKRTINGQKTNNTWGTDLVLEEWDDLVLAKQHPPKGVHSLSCCIHVMYRQHSTWQGSIQYVKERAFFRSESEMLDLIHQFLNQNAITKSHKRK